MTDKKQLIIAQVAHAINAAYCCSLGDESQPKWDEAPEWQKQSALNGVAMHIANPSATPEQSHENWLKHKQAEGWTFGEEKDVEAKTHPCMLPYAELPQEQKSKDYLFRAVVHALKDLPLDDNSEEINALRKQLAETTALASDPKEGVGIQYIGLRPEWSDSLYSTGLSFEKGQVRVVPASVAKKLLRHHDAFIEAKAEQNVVDDDTQALLNKAEEEQQKSELEEDSHYDVIAQLNTMTKEGLVQYAAERYQVKLNVRNKAEDLRKEVTELVNKFGVL